MFPVFFIFQLDLKPRTDKKHNLTESRKLITANKVISNK